MTIYCQSPWGSVTTLYSSIYPISLQIYIYIYRIIIHLIWFDFQFISVLAYNQTKWDAYSITSRVFNSHCYERSHKDRLNDIFFWLAGSIFFTWMEQGKEINSEMRGLILRNSSFISPWHETRRECIREWGCNSSEKQEGQQQVEPARAHSATHSSLGVRKGGVHVITTSPLSFCYSSFGR